MDWYLMVWRKYAEFDGRSRRKEYWMFALFNLLGILALGALGAIGLSISRDFGGVLFVPLGVYFLAAIIPSLAVTVRRLHDTGKSGWLLLLFMVLGIIPIIGFISGVIQIVILCMESDPGANQYGPNPKYPEGAGLAAVYAGFSPRGLGEHPQPFAASVSENGFGFCGSCGAKLKDSSQFCSACGAHA